MNRYHAICHSKVKILRLNIIHFIIREIIVERIIHKDKSEYLDENYFHYYNKCKISMLGAG
jgi:hypothetical protein